MHGLQHLLVDGPEGLIAAIAGQGLPVPSLLAWLLIAGEVALGVLLVVGLLARPAAGAAAVMMALVWVSQHVVTLPNAIAFVGGSAGVSGENALLLTVVTLSLALLGPGSASLDHARGSGRRKTR